MTDSNPTYSVTEISVGDPADVRVHAGHSLAAGERYVNYRPYRITITPTNGVAEMGHRLILSAEAAEAVVDGLIEALTAGGDRHEPHPF